MKHDDMVGETYRSNGRTHRVIGVNEDCPDFVLVEDCETGEIGAQNADAVRVLLRQALVAVE
ncbi:hypothetical protein [Magnetospirillum molischianum]|uniref:Uncharacterized protein n=1 Tax=Magnetospirillum molischianum DSM 120 TaxID=1150626 RepID=H8FY93_MAGML|nr:hypothetical protein [Magnetospirillum molischianum]CCG43331.1 hypothetical protein PHAMO_80122 [Magnetospirillum molischianum DSM 120]